MDYSLPGSYVQGIVQARILEQVAIPYTRGSSQLKVRTWVFHSAGRFFTIWATKEALLQFKTKESVTSYFTQNWVYLDYKSWSFHLRFLLHTAGLLGSLGSSSVTWNSLKTECDKQQNLVRITVPELRKPSRWFFVLLHFACPGWRSSLPPAHSLTGVLLSLADAVYFTCPIPTRESW